MIEVVEPGALTSVQTAGGRPGWRHVGVPVGGAADAWSARLANRLVGNDDDAALLELTLTGPTLRFQAETSIALTGAAFDATLDGLPLPPFVGRRVRTRLGAAHRDGGRCPRLPGRRGRDPGPGRARVDVDRSADGVRRARGACAARRRSPRRREPLGQHPTLDGPHAEWPDPDPAGSTPSAAGPGCLHRADVGRRGRGGPHGGAPRRAAARRRSSARSPRWASRSGRSRCLLTAGRS